MLKHPFVWLLLLAQLCTSSPLSSQQAEKIAASFLQSTAIKNFTVEKIDTHDAFTLVQYSTPAFVLLANTNDQQILAYSLSSQLDLENLPPALEELLQSYQKAMENPSLAKTAAVPPAAMTVSPLIKTKWGQNQPYSLYCPNELPVGCVALGIAQIMNYYQWPPHGCGEHSYNTYYFGFPVSANFNDAYLWDDIPIKLARQASESEYAALAHLLFDVGAAVEMDYNMLGSAASPVDAIIALKKYFAYSDQVKLRAFWDADIARDDARWVEAIRGELSQLRPVLYAAESNFNNGGHAFVIDGMDGDFFHINWGWEGLRDGYFSYNDFLEYNSNPNFIGGITPKPAQAYFSTDKCNGTAPLVVNFQNQSFAKNENIISCLWDFGDGSSSSQLNPRHTFAKPGAYHVKLIVHTLTTSDTLEQPFLVNCTSKRTIAYVSRQGCDVEGDGSPQHPFASIQHAINTCDNGDTVLVENGAYAESINFLGKQILVTSRILFTHNLQDAKNTIINADGAGSVAVFENGENAHSVLNGFTLTNGHGSEIIPNWLFADQIRTCGGAIMCRNESAPTLENLIITNNTANFGAALYCEDRSHPQLTGMHIFNNGTPQSGLCNNVIFLYESTADFNNIFYYNNANGNSPEFSFMGGAHVLVQNSILVWAENSGSYSWKIDDGSSAIFNNCTVWGNQQTVIYNHASDVEINNSIFWNFPQPGFYFSGMAPLATLTVNYSDIQHGKNFYNAAANSQVYWQDGNMQTDPMFYDPDALDFSLMITSPCRQAANPDEPVYMDMGANITAELLDPLPVELTAFSAHSHSNGVLLSWQTCSESSNLGFEIERKTQNSQFEKIAFIRGNGTTNEPHQYEFVDADAVAGTLTYRLKQLDTNGDFAYSEQVEVIRVEKFSLSQNYPNPFNGSTTIKFSIPIAVHVSFKIYNVNGQLVQTLANKKMQPGVHAVSWSGTDRFGKVAASGLYFYELQAGSFCQSGHMFYVR